VFSPGEFPALLKPIANMYERLAECDEILIVTPNSVVRRRYEEELDPWEQSI